MNGLYDILALAGRYLFAGLMLLIVLRAWRITIVDNRRARQLRQMTPETGLSGELVVLDGGEKAKNGMRYPVIREGIIGSSRKADIRIRHSSVRRVHAFFELTEKGLSLRANGDAIISRSWEDPVRRLTLRDGDIVEFGGVQLLLVLSNAQGGTRVDAPDRRDAADEGLFSVRTERPQPRPQRRKKPARPDPALDAYDDEGSLADDLFGAPDASNSQTASRPKNTAKTSAGKRRRANDTDEDLWL